MPVDPPSTIEIAVTSSGKLTSQVIGIPWYPGITVLQAMILGQAISGPKSFSFRAVYDSEYGAYVDQIDGLTEGGGEYWLLRLKDPAGPLSDFGPAEQIVAEPPRGSKFTIYWEFTTPPAPHLIGHLAKRLAV